MSKSFFFEQRDASLYVANGVNLDFIPHLHCEAEFFLLLDGCQQMTVDGQSHLLTPGEAALIFPNRVHSFTEPEDARYIIGILDMSAAGEYAPILLSGSCAQPFLSREQVHPDVYHCGQILADCGATLAPALSRAPVTAPQPMSLSPALARAYVSVILGRLLEALPLSPAAPSSAHDTAKDILLYINEHIAEPLSLDMLSKKLFINKYSISRIFSEQIGCNLHTYVNALRVSLAQNLLRDLSLSTAELISRCGFESERTFYRTFREHCGMTPRQYRRQSAQKNDR